MSDSLIHQLKQAAQEVIKSTDKNEKMKHLTRALVLFSQETSLLKSAYSRLHERFIAVNNELEKANKELKDKNLELKSLKSYLNNVFQRLSQGVFIIDSMGIITAVNEEAGKILEIDAQQVLLGNFWNHFSDNLFGFSLRRSLELLRCDKLTYARLKKKEIEVAAHFVNDNKKCYLIILLKDISADERLKAIAARNDRMRELGTLSAAIAHEIRNPLGGVRGYAALLYRDLENSPHLREMAGYILEGTKVLERMVSSILTFARPVEMQKEIYDLASLLREVCQLIKMDPAFSEKITLRLHLPGEKLPAPIDKGLLSSAILNLLVNALQSIENEGSITISLLQNYQTCEISISDTGRGISPEDLENIFSPFFTTRQKGNGLGLAETRKIIQAHFGKIDVRSRVGSGSTFTITLPLKR